MISNLKDNLTRVEIEYQKIRENFRQELFDRRGSKTLNFDFLESIQKYATPEDPSSRELNGSKNIADVSPEVEHRINMSLLKPKESLEEDESQKLVELKSQRVSLEKLETGPKYHKPGNISTKIKMKRRQATRKSSLSMDSAELNKDISDTNLGKTPATSNDKSLKRSRSKFDNKKKHMQSISIEIQTETLLDHNQVSVQRAYVDQGIQTNTIPILIEIEESEIEKRNADRIANDIGFSQSKICKTESRGCQTEAIQYEKVKDNLSTLKDLDVNKNVMLNNQSTQTLKIEVASKFTEVEACEIKNISDLKSSLKTIVPDSFNETFGTKKKENKQQHQKVEIPDQPRKMSLFKKFRAPHKGPADEGLTKPDFNKVFHENPKMESSKETFDLAKLPLLSGLSKLKARNINMLNSSLPLNENYLQNSALKDQRSLQSIKETGDRSNMIGTFSFQNRKETIDFEERLEKLRDIPEQDVLNFIDSFTPKFSQSVYQAKRGSVTLKHPEDHETLKSQIIEKLHSVSKDHDNVGRNARNAPKQENQDLKKFFTPRYATKKNSINNSFNQNSKHTTKNWMWHEDSLISRYDAMHLSNRNLKGNELVVESKALSQKPSSIFNESVVFKARGKNDAISNSSRNSRDSHYNPLEILNLTQPRFLIKRGNAPTLQNFRFSNAPNQTAKLPMSMSRVVNQRGTRNQKSTMKQLIKAATSRYDSS